MDYRGEKMNGKVQIGQRTNTMRDYRQFRQVQRRGEYMERSMRSDSIVSERLPDVAPNDNP